MKLQFRFEVEVPIDLTEQDIDRIKEEMSCMLACSVRQRLARWQEEQLAEYSKAIQPTVECVVEPKKKAKR